MTTQMHGLESTNLVSSGLAVGTSSRQTIKCLRNCAYRSLLRNSNTRPLLGREEDKNRWEKRKKHTNRAVTFPRYQEIFGWARSN